MNPRRRRILRALGLLGLGVGAVGLGLAGAAGWLTSPAGSAWLTQQVLSAADEAVPGSLTVARVKANLFVGRVELEQVELRDLNGQPVLRAERAAVRVDARGLFARKLRIRSVDLDGLDLRLEVLPDGQLGLLAALGVAPADPDAPPEPAVAWAGIGAWTVDLEALNLKDGRVAYADKRDTEAPIALSADGISLSAEGSVSGSTVALSRVFLLAALHQPVDTPLSLDGGLKLQDGNLEIEGLELGLADSRLTVVGRVAQVETAPVLALDLSLPRVSAADVERLAGQPVLAQDLGLSGRLEGPLSALVAALQVDAGAQGQAALSAQVNLEADPLVWSAAFDSAALSLDPLLVDLTEPVTVDGHWTVEGTGTAWPEGIAARFEVVSAAPVIWGEPLQALRLTGSLAEGVIRVDGAEASHPVGRVTLDGSIDLVGSEALVQVEAVLPDLRRLSRFDVAGVGGDARFLGTVSAGWAQDPVVVHLQGQLQGRALSYADADLQLAKLVVPLVADVLGERVQASGDLRASGLAAAGAGVEDLDLAGWSLRWSKAEGADLTGDLTARGVSVGDDAVRVELITGPIGGGAGPDNQPYASAAVVMTDLLLGQSAVRAEGGPVELSFQDQRLVVGFDLARSEQPFFGGRVLGDLHSSTWTVEELVLAPIAGRSWRATGPVHFRLTEGGFRELDLALVGGSSSLKASGDWVGAGAAGNTLQLALTQLQLAHVAEILAVYLPPAPGEPGLLEGLSGALDLQAGLADGEQPGVAEVTVGLRIADLAYPGVAMKLGVALDVAGPIDHPSLTLALSEPGGKLVLAQGAVPLRLVGGIPEGVACGDDIDLRALLTPGDLSRFAKVIPDLSLPEGAASAELRVEGDPCDPQLMLTAAAALDAGRRGERVRVDLQVERRGNRLVLDGLVAESLERRLELHGSADTHVDKVLGGLLGGQTVDPPPDLTRPSVWVEALDISLVPLAMPLNALSTFVQLPPGLDGLVGGGINIAGDVLAPTLSGALVLVGGSVGGIPVEQAQILLYPAVSDLDGGPGYRLETQLGFGRGNALGDLALTGFVPVSLDLDRGGDQALDRAGLDLEITGAGIPLDLLVGLLPGVPEAEGRLGLSGELTGSLLAPEYEMRVQLAGGRLVSEDLGLEFKDLDIDLRADPRRVDLNRLRFENSPLYAKLLTGTQGSGRLSVAGSMGMVDYAPDQINVHVSGEDLWLSATDATLLQTDLRGDITGRWPKLNVVAAAEIQQGRIALSEDLFKEGSSLDLAPMIAVHRKQALAERKQPVANELLSALTMDLDLDLHRGLKLVAGIPLASDYGEQLADLSTVNADVELSSPQLKVGLTGMNPAVNGTLEMTRGSLDILGRSFDVSGGSVSFVGDPADPILKVGAVYRSGRYGDIQVDVGGSVSDLVLDFKSDLYPDQTDVMSILVLGKPPAELSDAEGQTGGALLSAALGTVARNTLSRTVSTAFLGQIEFDGDSFKVGMPLWKSVFAMMELRSAADEDENQVELTLEWLLSRRWSAALVTGDAAQTSADLYYRWRF